MKGESWWGGGGGAESWFPLLTSKTECDLTMGAALEEVVSCVSFGQTCQLI